MIVIDPHLVRGSSNGGPTFHDRGGPYGATKGAKRVVAVDATGLPVTALVMPASTNDGVATRHLLEAVDFGCRLELVLVDRGTSASQADRLSRRYGIRVERVGWDAPSPVFRPIRHAWKVEVAHGKLMRSRRLAKSFENTVASATAWLLLACIGLHLSALSP
jgi:putative transposase